LKCRARDFLEQKTARKHRRITFFAIPHNVNTQTLPFALTILYSARFFPLASLRSSILRDRDFPFRFGLVAGLRTWTVNET
jgi:hypothetical protein